MACFLFSRLCSTGFHVDPLLTPMSMALQGVFNLSDLQPGSRMEVCAMLAKLQQPGEVVQSLTCPVAMAI